ncbi:MAG: gliding motility-associated C-terminal domain-containing protein, partial [Chitinophagaceae bacterium]
KFGSHVQLFAMGASTYTWTPVGSLNDPNSPAPIATPRETTSYIVSGSDSNLCIARDTVKVTIDYTNTMMIPSAFTPNGDGKNDFFKIVNPSFQRITEFRVFNRWGQEVFSTNDINQGWDGKWKGIDQPIGTYEYLIRLANVDGQAEVYKGDVTLIR